METMFAKYAAQAKKSKRENRMIFNHICIRVEDLDDAVDLFRESFGIEGAKMYKISNLLTPGIPVELIDYELDDWRS